MAAYRYALVAGQRNHGLAPRESLLVAADSLAAALNMRAQERVDVITVSRRLIATLEDGDAPLAQRPRAVASTRRYPVSLSVLRA